MITRPYITIKKHTKSMHSSRHIECIFLPFSSDHIDYIHTVAGPHHVGIGSDFDGMAG